MYSNLQEKNANLGSERIEKSCFRKKKKEKEVKFGIKLKTTFRDVINFP